MDLTKFKPYGKSQSALQTQKSIEAWLEVLKASRRPMSVAQVIRAVKLSGIDDASLDESVYSSHRHMTYTPNLDKKMATLKYKPTLPDIHNTSQLRAYIMAHPFGTLVASLADAYEPIEKTFNEDGKELFMVESKENKDAKKEKAQKQSKARRQRARPHRKGQDRDIVITSSSGNVAFDGSIDDFANDDDANTDDEMATEYEKETYTELKAAAASSSKPPSSPLLPKTPRLTPAASVSEFGEPRDDDYDTGDDNDDDDAGGAELDEDADYKSKRIDSHHNTNKAPTSMVFGSSSFLSETALTRLNRDRSDIVKLRMGPREDITAMCSERLAFTLSERGQECVYPSTLPPSGTLLHYSDYMAYRNGAPDEPAVPLHLATLLHVTSDATPPREREFEKVIQHTADAYQLQQVGVSTLDTELSLIAAKIYTKEEMALPRQYQKARLADMANKRAAYARLSQQQTDTDEDEDMAEAGRLSTGPRGTKRRAASVLASASGSGSGSGSAARGGKARKSRSTPLHTITNQHLINNPLYRDMFASLNVKS